ncbi:MAG TPA: chemotaxis protein CheB [Gammaproteobacteria bacterium]|nr:chemotaxis protein CheB [Gammaproteobacteria bacterium]
MGSTEADSLHVAGIGASAGGLSALKTLLSSLTTGTGTAWVIVVHLAPDHESQLADLLQASTVLPVRQVAATVPLVADRVYVIPPNANLEAIDTHLRVTPLEPVRLQRAPIDRFFRTLARVHDGSAVAVVLTGEGSDGSLGLRCVREAGGLVIAQAPDEAEAPSMPRSAIATGLVDQVLPLAQIPDAVLRFCRTIPALQLPEATEEPDWAVDVRELVRAHTTTDVDHYTPRHLAERVRRRMKLHGHKALRSYLGLLRTDAGEAQGLFKDLLLNITEFFRADVFDRLEQKLIPLLLRHHAAVRRPLRLWSIGCSTGEEAYSLAILLLEHAEQRRIALDFQIFATDQERDAVLRARAGLYPEGIASYVRPDRLERFFQREDHHYRVGRQVHDRVVFAVHHLLKDPPFIRLDLIVCRHMLGDFERSVQREALEIFHHALKPDGQLVIAETEVLADNELFEAVAGQPGVFRRAPLPLQAKRSKAVGAAPAGVGALGTDQYFRIVHQRLRERLAPPSVLIDERNDIVHYSSGAGHYVRMPGGVPTSNLFALVGEPLRTRLRDALDDARGAGKSSKSAPVLLEADGTQRTVVLEVLPAPELDRSALVVFHDAARGAAASAEDLITAVNAFDVGTDASTEELQLANEELQSTNEELRFVMRELETAKHELQGMNDALAAIDEENRRRLSEVTELSRDLQRLLESTGVPTLFLDRDLQIVRFTPQIEGLFRVRESDRGRPLAHVQSRFEYGDIARLAREVLDALAPIEREVKADDGRCFLVRALIYRSDAALVDGVVMTFVDISQRKRAEIALREANRRKDEFLATLAHELRNPLAPIRTGLELLETAKHDATMIGRIQRTMLRQTNQLVRIVDDLMDVARVSGGRLRLRTARTDIAEVVEDAVAAARPFIEEAGHSLSVDVAAGPLLVNGDAARLIQVLVNLLNNAAKYTPRGGQIALRVSRTDEHLNIAIADSGVGIAAENLPHVFELFYSDSPEHVQLHSSGLGVGLTLARSLIEMQGGTLTARSEGLGRGSEFVIRLPAAAPAPAARGEDAAARDAAASPAEPQRVLIVDDNVDAAETLAMLIATASTNEVRVANSGSEALRAAAEFRPDIALLDIGMPGMDGFELARRLREQEWGKRVTLVALTGWGQDEDKRRTKSAGFDHHFVKPADHDALQALLRQSAGRS